MKIQITAVNKLDLTWKQSFLILVDSEIFGWRYLYQFELTLLFKFISNSMLIHEDQDGETFVPKSEHSFWKMMAERNVPFQVNPDDIQVENDGNDSNNGNQDAPIPPQNVQAPQIVVPAGAPGAPEMTLAFKVEQSKLPEFFGQKGKDNITDIIFIRIL